ncbi:MAG: F0F1 ATP synthase subunit delta [Bacteroides sp.]|nr:F0F1 ATP synthase subunit delta [Bacteroides sp.]
MNIGIVAMRYANALFGYAVEHEVSEKVYREMIILSGNFLKVPKLKIALNNPILSGKEKLDLLKSATGGNMSRELERFMELVLKNHREKLLQFVAVLYLDIYRKANNINIGKLTIASPLEKGTEDHIKNMIISRIHDGTVEFETIVNPEIEGGFILDIDTYRLDASVARQFKRIKKQFIEKNKRIV